VRQARITSLGLVLALLLTVASSQAATFNIADGDVAGLIAAIQAANASGGSTINLAPHGNYILTAVADSSPDYQSSGAAGLPYIRSQITINGNGATIQRSTASGTPDFVVFEVSGVNATLTLNAATITGGSFGGLHMAYGNAVLQGSTVTQNSGGGGIIDTCGSLSLVNSTVSYNASVSAYGGGGIFLWQFSCPPNEPTANISFSTIFENANPGWGRGNAIGTNNPNQNVFVKNSILASPSHPNENVCNPGELVSLGHNIGGDASCAPALTGPGDINRTNPMLGPTVYNSGPTPVNLPAANSPAIDEVPLANCSDVSGNPVPTDQRGVSRPQGSACDAGSVEIAYPRYNVCLLYNTSFAVPSGATDPIKLQLCDGAGNDLSSSSVILNATGITQTSTQISGPVQSPGNANPDNDFRFDSSLGPTGGYIFNLRTAGLGTGTYRLNFTVTGDSFVYAAPFQVR
jgi:hypothetical protein